MACLTLGILFAIHGLASGQALVTPRTGSLPGLAYTNNSFPAVPWSIHVVRVERTNGLYEIETAHAGGKAIGMETLSRQVAGFKARSGKVVAAINGDFYERGRAYAGAPRGLQVSGGELLSAPSGEATVWIDEQGQPHLGKIGSAFHIVWPDGSATPFGLNGERHGDLLELYTPAMGPSTRTAGGREMVLEAEGNGFWLPLGIGQVYAARVREIRQTGNTRIEPGTMVLSAGSTAAKLLPSVTVGTVLKLSTASVPALHGVQAAISGGPILVAQGRTQKMPASFSGGFELYSMRQRHPRAAVGWNRQYFFLVVVDGRQEFSAGMTLDELSRYLLQLGCEEAMNFDGGGSATLWYRGEVRNSPCEQVERDISNCLIVLARGSRGSR